jgi:hypothetical protein
MYAFGGDVPPFARKQIASKIGITYEKKGGLGALISLAASIAIPFAAPAIAGSLMSSMGIAATTFSTTLGSAIVGAGLGAASSLVTGQKMGQAALMGFIGGGTAGYLKGLDQVTTGPAGANVGKATAGVDTTKIGVANLGDKAVVAQQGADGVWTAAGQTINPSQIAYGGNIPTSGLAEALSSPQTAANMLSSAGQLQTNLPTAFGGTAGTFGSSANPAQFYNPGLTTAAPAGQVPFDVGSAASYGQAGLDVTKATQAAAAAPAGKPLSVYDTIKAKVSDPKMQADLVLRAAGQLAGSAMAGSGLSEEQQAMVDAQKAELAQLQQSNRALFEQRLNEASQLIGESKYYDPAYFGMQAQRGTATAIQRQKEDALRNMSATDPRRAGLRSAENRRYNLDAATRGQTSYLQGADAAQAAKLRVAQAGLGALPTGGVSVMGSSNEATQLLNKAEEQRRLALESTGQLFGSITGNTASKSLG